MKKLTISALMLLLTLGLFARPADNDGSASGDSLSAEFHDDHIDLSDGRELQFVKHRLPHVGSQVVMTAPKGATVTIQYEDGKDPFVAKVPFVYKVPLERNQENFRLVVKEGIPAQTWFLDFQHESGYSMEFSSEDED